MSARIRVDVVYALAERQELAHLELKDGATLQEAVQASGLLERHPDIDLGGRNKVGIYSKLAKLDTPLRDRDRVEIYRPLIADPKEVRKQRAASGKVMKKGGGDADAGAADSE